MMFEQVSLESQLAAQQQDTLRILISGAGVAGVTIAQLLRQQGLHPVLIERDKPQSGSGYMLALLPLVDPVMHRLDLQQRYREQSQVFDTYALHGRHSQLIQQTSMQELLGDFGEYRGIERGALLDVLASGGTPVTYETTIASMQHDQAAVQIRFAAPTGTVESSFDALIVTEGMHSTTRSMILPDTQVETFDSGWGGWVAWTDADPAHAETGEEFWGAGCFVGLYPVKNRTGVIVCGDRAETAAGKASFIATVRASLGGHNSRCDQALNAVSADPDSYFWTLTDCRSAHWATGRTLLLGDTAAGFLPTAGVGAALAMEAAGQLAQRLSEVSSAGVATALHDFERSQRPRTEAAQGNSRQLARLTFRRSNTVAAVRDVVLRTIPLRLALGPIRKLHTNAPVLA
jgi:2-polyprenyl-6-methoxyphenol hydroxylase-like FAD-dependent oxidoreductase